MSQKVVILPTVYLAICYVKLILLKTWYIAGKSLFAFLLQEGRTPLHYSAALHDSGIFYRYLLKCGADENIQDKVH